MNDIGVMQSDIGLAQRRTAAGIESCVPLFVLVAESDNGDIALADQGFGTNAVHFR